MRLPGAPADDADAETTPTPDAVQLALVRAALDAGRYAGVERDIAVALLERAARPRTRWCAGCGRLLLWLSRRT